MQKALRNEIHEVEGKVIPKAEEHDGFADTISTSASEAKPPAPHAVLKEDQVEEIFRGGR